MSINLHTKKLKLKKFKKIERKNEVFYFTEEGKNKFEMLSRVNNGKEMQDFLNNHILLEGNVEEEVENITNENVSLWYFVKKVLENGIKKQRESIMING